MILTHYIRSNNFDNHLNTLLELGNQQGGYITREQLYQELYKSSLLEAQRMQLIDLLSKHNIIVRRQHITPEKPQEELDRRKYFIDDDKVKLRPVKQIDECLIYEEFCDLFLAKYDEKLKKFERQRIFQRLSNRITHVEKCEECISWCKCGHHYYVDTCNGTVAFPNALFFKFFTEEYEKDSKKPAGKILKKTQKNKNKKAEE